MSRRGIEPGPPRWEESHSNSLLIAIRNICIWARDHRRMPATDPWFCQKNTYYKKKSYCITPFWWFYAEKRIVDVEERAPRPCRSAAIMAQAISEAQQHYESTGKQRRELWMLMNGGRSDPAAAPPSWRRPSQRRNSATSPQASRGN
jgi:hypothetical protein